MNRHQRLETLEGLGGDSSDVEAVVAAVEELDTIVSEQAVVAAKQAEQLSTQADQIAALIAANVDRDRSDAERAAAATSRDLQIDEMKAALGTFFAPLLPIDRDQPPSRNCGGGGSSSSCTPTVEADGEGTLMLNAFGGKVMLESEECSSTDLCEIIRTFKALLQRFADI